jgi:hypothetical protein
MSRTSMPCRQSGIYSCLACEEANVLHELPIAEGNRFPACRVNKAVWWILRTPLPDNELPPAAEQYGLPPDIGLDHP